MKKLQNKVAVITGGSAGIGLATAKLFAAEGAYVFITGRRQTELDKALAEIGSGVTGVCADSASTSDIAKLFDSVKAKKGQIDILFANAGGGGFEPLEAATETSFDRTFDANVKGTFFTVQKALPLMRDGGSIILMSSAVASSGIAGFSIYAGAKAAIRAFARCWIMDLKPRGIRVNVVSPGPIATPGLNALAPNENIAAQMQKKMAEDIPAGRVGKPEEAAQVVLFLASEASSFVNGIELFVDGGLKQI